MTGVWVFTVGILFFVYGCLGKFLKKNYKRKITAIPCPHKAAYDIYVKTLIDIAGGQTMWHKEYWTWETVRYLGVPWQEYDGWMKGEVNISQYLDKEF